MQFLEKDAWQYWCPLARALRDGSGINRESDGETRPGGPLSTCRCLGAECAAWEFVDPPLMIAQNPQRPGDAFAPGDPPPAGFEAEPHPIFPNSLRYVRGVADCDRMGRCGAFPMPPQL